METAEKETAIIELSHDKKACTASVMAVKDALYALSGRWKLPLIIALTDGGPMRFNDIQRTLDGITPKVLSKELRELELNEFVERIVLPTKPVTVTYKLTPYSDSLKKVLYELRVWGMQHRERIAAGMKRNGSSK